MGLDRLHIQREDHSNESNEEEESIALDVELRKGDEDEEESSILSSNSDDAEVTSIETSITEPETNNESTSCIKPYYVSVSYMIASTISISTMSVLLKRLGSMGYPPFELAFFRSIVILLIVLCLLWKQGLSPLGPPVLRLRLLCILRGVFGFGGFSSLIYSVLHLPISDAITLTYTAPIFTIILARVVLKEPIVWLDIIGLMCNIAGVLVIEQPKFLFSSHSSSDDSSSSSSFSSSSSSSSSSFSSSSSSSSEPFFDERSLAVAVSLFGAMSASCAFISVKYIGNSVHPIQLVAYFAMLSTLLSTIITFSFETWIIPSSVFEVIQLIMIGFLGFTAQILVNMALQKEKAARMANFGYLSIVWGFLWQILLYGSLSTLSVLGAILVSGYAIVATLKGSELEKKVAFFISTQWQRWCCHCGSRGSSDNNPGRGQGEGEGEGEGEGRRKKGDHHLLIETPSVRGEDLGDDLGDVELRVISDCRFPTTTTTTTTIVHKGEELGEVKEEVKEEGIIVKER